jgi:alpha-1,3-rhamnosyl/mannosyltransferase
MKRADVIVTDSNFSKTEIEKYYPKYADKVRVVPCGVDLERFHPIEDTAQIIKVKQKFNLSDEYFLYIGTIEPRKNLTRLIEGYSKFVKKYPECPNLVLAGGKGWLNDEIYSSIEKLGLKDKATFTEYIPSEDMCALINGAMGFLFPSIYEGFGMPPLEAMACGVPVLTSHEASLPEVVGDCAVMVDAYDTQSIADGIERLYLDKNLREELSVKGLERAKLYTWENASQTLYSIYEELANGR